MQVSRAVAQLDEVLQEWRERPLGEITYLYVDARYEKVRQSGQVRDAAVLMATGITPGGERQVLGVSVSLSEHESHWKSFLKGLKNRGMNGVKLVISDDHVLDHLLSRLHPMHFATLLCIQNSVHALEVDVETAPDAMIMALVPAIVTHAGPGTLAVGFFAPHVA